MLAVLLLPAAWFAWQWRQMPQLGFYHDDGIYWVTAKSWAQGDGYRIPSLPERPLQTKYPPVFPALLSLVWRLNPNFPANLPLATLLVWCLFPIYLGLVWALFKEYGFSPRAQLLLAALAALNPIAVLYSISLMPELLFTVLLLSAVLAAGRSAWLAGAFGAAAYLTKSAGLPLLAAIPLVYALRREHRKAGQFLFVMLPAVVAWQAWVWAHVSRSTDLVTLYYTNYFGFHRYNIEPGDLPRVIWYNLDALFMSAGQLLTFDTSLFESKHLERIVGLAAIVGTVRLARRTGKLHYPLAAAFFAAMLLVWNYPPDQRFVFPLYPLLLAGLATELLHLLRVLQLAWRKNAPGDRAAAICVGAVSGLFVGFVLAANLYGLFAFEPRLLRAYEEDLQSRRPAYRWLAASAAADARVFAYDDPLVYLYTGRRACSMPVPTKFWYHNDTASIDHMVDTLPAFARAQGMDYLLLTAGGFYRDLHAERAMRLTRVVAADPGCRPTFTAPGASIYALH